MSWHNGDATYLDEVVQDVEDRFSISLKRKWLFALSAGGPTGFRLMNRNTSEYEGYVCIASGLPQRQIAKLAFPQPILVLNGINDRRFPIQNTRRSISEMKKSGLSVTQVELEADHFFLLTQRVETLQIIESFIDEHTNVVVETPVADSPNWIEKLSPQVSLMCFGLFILGYLYFLKVRFGRNNPPSSEGR